MIVKIKIGLTGQIFIGLALGIIFGYLSPDIASHLKPVGDAFIRMIKMIIVPLIFSTLVIGICGTGDFKKLGRLGGKSILWFEIVSVLALAIGLFVVNILKPGEGISLSGGDASIGANAADKAKGFDFISHLLDIIPSNVIHAAAQNDLLQIIFFSCFFGVALAHIGEKGKIILDICQSTAEIMFKVTHYVMLCAPIGVFAMISYAIGNFGLSMLIPLGKLVFSLHFAIFIFIIFLLLIAYFAGGRVNYFKVIKSLRQPLLLGYSTATSEAALPLVMRCLEKLRIPKSIVTFVIPTGYSFNLDGSTLYSSLAVVFLAQMYDIDLSISQQILILLTLMVSTKGIAGVPGASIIVIAGTAASFGIPTEGIAIILGVDRIMDMARTFCNILGNAVATVVVGVWEKEVSAQDINEAYKELEKQKHTQRK